MTIAARKPNKPKPAPATKVSSQLPNAFSWGAICARAVPTFTRARCQNWAIGWPMIGHSASEGGGSGMEKPPSDIRRARSAPLSISARLRTVSGTIITTSSRMVTIQAAMPPRPPSRCRSRS